MVLRDQLFANSGGTVQDFHLLPSWPVNNKTFSFTGTRIRLYELYEKNHLLSISGRHTDEVKELSVGEKQSGLEKNDFRLGLPLFYI